MEIDRNSAKQQDSASLEVDQAAQVLFSISQMDKPIYFTADDIGVGFDLYDPFSHPGRHGLNIMRERAEAAGGSTMISSVAGKRPLTEVSVPYQRAGEIQNKENAE